MTTDPRENWVTIHARIDGVEVAETVKIPYGPGNPRFYAETVQGGIFEASVGIEEMLKARFGERPRRMP